MLAVALAACSTTAKVQTQAKPGADLTGYRTFALMPLPATGSTANPGLMLRLAEPARATVIETLQAKGFQAADRATADFTVNLRGESMPKVEVTEWGYNMADSARWSGRHAPVYTTHRDVQVLNERTLTVEIFDNKNKELAWVGWVKEEAYGEVKVETLQNAIRDILTKFPSASVPAKAK